MKTVPMTSVRTMPRMPWRRGQGRTRPSPRQWRRVPVQVTAVRQEVAAVENFSETPAVIATL